jgi:hypothetical protein
VPALVRACKRSVLERDDVVRWLGADRRWPEFELDPEAVRRRLPAHGRVRGREAVRAFYGAYADHWGKPRWGDKTPGYLREMRRIQRTLPEARFIHIIRDARDVALSMTQAELTMPDSVAQAARRWDKQLRRGRAEAEQVQHYREVRYESLVLDTEPTLRGICQFLELPWDDAVLDYHARASERMAQAAHDRPRPGRDPIPAWYPQQIHARAAQPPAADRVGRWRTEMAPEDRATCERVAGELLEQLGYEVERASAGPA